MSSFTGHLDTRWLGKRKFQTLSPFRFDYGELGSGVGIFVPEGTITDLMSLPWFLRAFISRTREGSLCALPHDLVYRLGIFQTYKLDQDNLENPEPLEFGPPIRATRPLADVMIADAMRAQKFSPASVGAVHTGLKIGGWKAWNRYRGLDDRKRH